MKTTLRIFSLVMVFVLALSVLTACEIPQDVLDSLPDEIVNLITGNNPEQPPVTEHEHSFVEGKCECGEEDPNYVPPVAGDGKIKVYWLQGQKELRVDEVEKGTILTSWEPKVSGKEFKGWYSDPGCTKAFDFTKPVEAETEIYASFKTVAGGGDDPVEPEYADYYLIGTGMGSLAVSGWDHNNSATQLGMTDNGNGTYTITIDFYAGDMFQICHGLSWDGQMGLGYISGAALVEGSETQGEVKDAEGNVVFTGVQEYSNPMTAWNITCAVGQDGKYTFTLDPINGTIAWELLERYEAKEQPTVENAIYFIGTFNNWDTLGLTDEWKLTKSEDGKTWTGKLTVTEDMYADWTEAEMGFSCVALKLYDKGASRWIGYNGDNNLGLTAGVYEFTYDVETGTFTYNLEGEAPVVPETPDSELVFVGTMNEWDTTNSTGEWALTVDEDGKTWTGTLVVTEDMYADWTEAELGQLCAAVKLYDKGTFKWIAYEGDKNLALTVGTYHFKYVVGDANFTYWADGEDEPAAPEVTPDPELTPDPVVPTESMTVYFAPGAEWPSDGARFALYTWNDAGDLWIDMTDDDADGIYECELPAGYAKVIFCRMNPVSAENNWDNKWNQTIDVALSANGENLYTITNPWGAADGKGEGSWSTKE